MVGKSQIMSDEMIRQKSSYCTKKSPLQLLLGNWKVCREREKQKVSDFFFALFCFLEQKFSLRLMVAESRSDFLLSRDSNGCPNVLQFVTNWDLPNSKWSFEAKEMEKCTLWMICWFLKILQQNKHLKSYMIEDRV
jgi:hypothetical protein